MNASCLIMADCPQLEPSFFPTDMSRVVSDYFNTSAFSSPEIEATEGFYGRSHAQSHPAGTGCRDRSNHNHVNSTSICPFRAKVVDECHKSRFYARALEFYLLEGEWQPGQTFRCPMSKCPKENFEDVRDMLRHLKICEWFDEGWYRCPICNDTERFRTVSRKRCSWERTTFSTKFKDSIQASADLVRRLSGSKQTHCPTCRCKIETREEAALEGYYEMTTPNHVYDSQDIKIDPRAKCSELEPKDGIELKSKPIPPTDWIELLGDHPVFEAEPVEMSVPSELRRKQSVGSQSKTRSSSSFSDMNVPKNMAPNSINAFNFSSPTEVFSLSTHSGGFSSDTSPTSAYSAISSTSESSNGAQLLRTGTRRFGDTQSLCAPKPNILPSTTLRPSSTGSRISRNVEQAPLSIITDQSLVETDIANWQPENTQIGYGMLQPMHYTEIPIEQTFNGFYLATRAETRQSNLERTPFMVKPVTTQMHHVAPANDYSPASLSATSLSDSDTSYLDSLELCPFCGFKPTGKAENFKQYLKKHLKTHNVEKFECNICGKSYTRQDNKAQHAKRAHGDSCKRRFGSRGSLGSHYQQRKKPRAQKGEMMDTFL